MEINIINIILFNDVLLIFSLVILYRVLISIFLWSDFVDLFTSTLVTKLVSLVKKSSSVFSPLVGSSMICARQCSLHRSSSSKNCTFSSLLAACLYLYEHAPGCSFLHSMKRKLKSPLTIIVLLCSPTSSRIIFKVLSMTLKSSFLVSGGLYTTMLIV